MEQTLINFLKKPLIIRSLYFISCMTIAFGLGIITEYSLVNQHNNPQIELPAQPVPLALRYKTPTLNNVYDTMPAEPAVSDQTEHTASSTPVADTTKQFVASKTGTKYYPPGCGSISRIKPENRIYFATEQAAEEKGYTRTTACN